MTTDTNGMLPEGYWPLNPELKGNVDPKLIKDGKLPQIHTSRSEDEYVNLCIEQGRIDARSDGQIAANENE